MRRRGGPHSPETHSSLEPPPPATATGADAQPPATVVPHDPSSMRAHGPRAGDSPTVSGNSPPSTYRFGTSGRRGLPGGAGSDSESETESDDSDTNMAQHTSWTDFLDRCVTVAPSSGTWTAIAVLLASICVAIYYGLRASDLYAARTAFHKQCGMCRLLVLSRTRLSVSSGVLILI